MLHFTHTTTVQGRQQLAKGIGLMADISQVSLDTTAGTLALHGTSGQTALAEWLFNALDKPAVGQPPAQHSFVDYRVPGSTDDIVRIYYLAHAETPDSLQEAVNLIRSMGDVRQGFSCSGPRAMVFRGTAGQIGVAASMIDALDKPAGQPAPHSTTPAFPVPRALTREPEVSRVFYLAFADTPGRMQETVNLIRAVADMQRVFPYSALKALALRGSAEQMALAEWLFNQLDKAVPQPGQHTASPEYHFTDRFNPVVRVFNLAHADSPAILQETINLMRGITDIQRAFPVTDLRTMAVRGTASQIAMAEWLFNELDKPAGDSAAHDYQPAGAGEDVARLCYLQHTDTTQSVQELVAAVRSTANVRRAFPSYSRKLVAVRGTADQVAVAERVIKERDK